MTIEEVVAYLDNFYSNKLNANIPIADAYACIAIQQRKGKMITKAVQEALSEAASEWRNKYCK